MGTNYYLKQNVCRHCGHAEREVHIGKSSVGWAFLFEAHKDAGLTSFAAWKKVFKSPGSTIVDEYGETITAKKFISWIEAKQPDRKVEDGPCDWAYLDPEGYRFWSRSFS